MHSYLLTNHIICRFSLYEPIEFIKTHLKDKLEWSQVRDNVAIHVPCSSKKMGITEAFSEVAGLCAKEVTPSNIPCCGEHFFLPEQIILAYLTKKQLTL